eukprot:scaffold10106_cov193-Alexandrium_tamarense.AAC.2
MPFVFVLIVSASLLHGDAAVHAFAPSSSCHQKNSLSLRIPADTCITNTIQQYASLTTRARERYDINHSRLHSTPSNLSNDTTSDATSTSLNKRDYIQPYLRQLFLLCRPVNFPIVALFHVLGVHQAVQFWKATSSLSTAATSSQSLLVPLLKYPSMMMVLISLLLVTSTSMITNDYYDARNGVDTVEPTTNIHDSDTDSNNYEHYHPLAAGLLPFTITKAFDSYLYAILLLSSAFVPGVVSRLLVIGGAIITYLYTVHLKPKTWIKNLSCAALVAMSPVTSGLAAWHVLCGGAFLQSQGIGGVGGTLVTTGSSRLIFKSPLIFLVVSLFAGIMSREIMMDITDCESDAKARIVTIPVKYGKKFASKVALGWTLVSAFGACWLPLTSLIPSCSVDSVPVTTFFGASYSALISSLTSFATNSDARSLLLSVVGSVLLVQRAFAVWKTSGDDVNLAERAVREGFLSVVLVLASFV